MIFLIIFIFIILLIIVDFFTFRKWFSDTKDSINKIFDNIKIFFTIYLIDKIFDSLKEQKGDDTEDGESDNGENMI